MYKDSPEQSLPNIFGSFTSHLCARKFNRLTDKNAWYNVFFREITSRIDEELFAYLFVDTGRGCASIRQLIGMAVLKEGFGWSDRQMFEECEFNMAVMRALGFHNLDDKAPVLSTYYDFNGRLQEFEEVYGVDLLQICFESLSKEQVKYYEVCGKKIRMDSKLIQSNIAVCTRLQLVISVIQHCMVAYKKCLDIRLSEQSDIDLLERLLSHAADNITFHINKSEQILLFEQLGLLMKKLVHLYSDSESEQYQILKRCYLDQYSDQRPDDPNQPPDPKSAKDIRSSALQSASDQDAAFRKKGQGSNEQKVKGFQANITETCGSGLRLILNTQLVKANVSETDLFLKGITTSACVSQQTVERVWTDAGYDGYINRLELVNLGVLKWHMAKNKGMQLTYEFRLENGHIFVNDLKTNKEHIAEKLPNGNWRIPNERSQKMPYKYWDQRTMQSYIAMIQLRPERGQEQYELRAPVESTIHEMFHRLKAGKSKYRGLTRNKMAVRHRALWVNMSRIGRHLCLLDKNRAKLAENAKKAA